ncbi:MAG: hypothetical protein AAF171_14395 [Cyanobacteria bacterium P01_A01_bin.116]
MRTVSFYSVSDNEVNILRVVSGYRDLQDIFSEWSQRSCADAGMA